MRPILLCLMGPTSAGKTALAAALHERFAVDVVSVDASQVYRGMDIGTGKPSLDEQARTPHRLIDICDPAERYSAARFCADAHAAIDDIVRRGRVPLLVGGTMFYFQALEYGLSPLPSADPMVRAHIAMQAATRGWPALHDELKKIDPVSAARIDPHDAQRVQRALEVIEVTGAPLKREFKRTPDPRFHWVKFGLWPEARAVLHERIRRRFLKMLEQGLVTEVEGLYRRGDLTPDLPSMRTVGYRQVWHYLTGTANYNEMIEKAVAATRQLAKRQLTWLRHYPNVRLFDCTGDSPVQDLQGAVALAMQLEKELNV